MPAEPVANSTRGGFWRRRVLAPILEQLQQGITPEKIALTLALGAVIGIFPILGATTLLCGLVGLALRLNQPVIQLVNYFVYPLQLILLLPFYRAGESLFRQPHLPIFSVGELMTRFQAGPGQFLLDYGLIGVYGVVVWALLAPLLVAVIYYATRLPLRRLVRRG